MTVRYIRITSIPGGGAPDWVRQRWVGLELPMVLKQKQDGKVFTQSFRQNPGGFFSELWRRILAGKNEKAGFAVATLAALAVLEKSSPDAAQWWKDNTPHLMKPGQYFVFQTDCCHLLEEKKAI